VGDYIFPALQPGPYTVHVELTGFKPYEIKNNQVLANNRLPMRPLRLEVGTLAETVSVTAVGETLATTVTSHQALLESSQIENMAIKGRDPISLLKILPGVQLQANDQSVFRVAQKVDGNAVPGIQNDSIVYFDLAHRGQKGAVEPLFGTKLLRDWPLGVSDEIQEEDRAGNRTAARAERNLTNVHVGWSPLRTAAVQVSFRKICSTHHTMHSSGSP
jgi:hypothetical protein